MTLRPRGHIPDHPEVAKRRVGLHLHPARADMLAAAANLPMATTNRSKLQPAQGGPGNLDQKDLGACEGFAHASAGTLRLAIMGVSQGLISPIQLYLGALMIDSTSTPAVAYDNGTMPSSIDSAWLRFGACLAKDDDQYPASQATLYVDPTNPNSNLKLPTIEKLFADSNFRYKGEYFITSLGPQRVLDALTVLASGRPITDAIPASGPEFQGYSGGVLGALSGPIDHANLIVDYTWAGTPADWASYTSSLRNGDVSAAKILETYLMFHCVNSWGMWGESDAVSSSSGGLYRADINYFTQAQDLSVIDILPA